MSGITNELISIVDGLIEAAKCVGHYETLRDSGEDTIAYWKERTADLRAKLLADLPSNLPLGFRLAPYGATQAMHNAGCLAKPPRLMIDWETGFIRVDYVAPDPTAIYAAMLKAAPCPTL